MTRRARTDSRRAVRSRVADGRGRRGALLLAAVLVVGCDEPSPPAASEARSPAGPGTPAAVTASASAAAAPAAASPAAPFAGPPDPASALTQTIHAVGSENIQFRLPEGWMADSVTNEEDESIPGSLARS